MTQTPTLTIEQEQNLVNQAYNDLEAAALAARRASARFGKGLLCRCYMKTAEDCVTDCLR